MSRAGGRYTITLEPRSIWTATIAVSLHASRAPSRPRASGVVSLSERRASWLKAFPTLHSTWRELDLFYRQALTDLASLVIVDEAVPDNLVLGDGLPWFMTLFGRDALLTALMLLPFDRTIARGVLRTLARHQGTKDDPASEEQPGKIPHELRAGTAAAHRGRGVYYGTIDATPLFVILAGEAHRLPWPDIEALIPTIRAAVGWMQEGADADGFLEYGESAHGLRNQGWKDSWNGIQYADGGLPRGSIALAEVQICVPNLARGATLFDEAGEHDEAETSRGRANAMAERFRRDYWMEEAD
ncbi:MAG: amylo-alpha-1,6-glucosidase, partial [bacterium]